AAREAAEQAVAARVQEAMAAVAEREAAEARTTEALARVQEAAAAATEAHRLRVQAEDRAERVAIDRQAIESSIRHQTELVEASLSERLAAEQRAAELAAELVALRSAVVDALREKGGKRTLAALQTAVDTVAGDGAAGGTPSTDGSAVRKAPLDVREAPTRREGSPHSTGGGLGRLSPVSSRAIGEVSVDDEGMLTMPGGATFDLYDKGTTIQVQGKPGQRRWKVDVVSAAGVSATVDPRLTDPEEFTRELLRWRPELAG
ncbi:MAG: hypothetical protein QM572_09580, partial [Nocardioides sp.]|uniref:hypothetical protein n=1 Tax=Nocardioides sp. TaxID=35761 RepID=UPI0039E382EF